jgi:hypothetical protein
MGETGHYRLGPTAELRGTKCYVAWDANRKGFCVGYALGEPIVIVEIPGEVVVVGFR